MSSYSVAYYTAWWFNSYILLKYNSMQFVSIVFLPPFLQHHKWQYSLICALVTVWLTKSPKSKSGKKGLIWDYSSIVDTAQHSEEGMIAWAWGPWITFHLQQRGRTSGIRLQNCQALSSDGLPPASVHLLRPPNLPKQHTMWRIITQIKEHVEDISSWNRSILHRS